MRIHLFILWCLIKIWPKLFDRYYAEYQYANNHIRKNGSFNILSFKNDSNLLKEGLWYKVDFYLAKRHPGAYNLDELRIQELKEKPKEITAPLTINIDSGIII